MSENRIDERLAALSRSLMLVEQHAHRELDKMLRTEDLDEIAACETTIESGRHCAEHLRQLTKWIVDSKQGGF